MEPISEETMTILDVKDSQSVNANNHSEQSDKAFTQAENWKRANEALKDAREREARQNQQIDSLTKTVEQLIQSKQQPQVEDDPWHGLDDDEAFEVRKAKEVVSKAIPKAVKKALEEHTKQQEEEARKVKSSPDYLEKQARSKYEDFDSVMTNENIDDIIKKVPSVHKAILNGEDPIDAAYQFIINSSAYERKKATKNTNMVEKTKFADNQTKPKSPNQTAVNQNVTAANNFGRLTKEQQKELWIDHNKKLGRRM